MFNSHANVITKWLPGRAASRIKKVSIALDSGFYSFMETNTYQHVWIKKKQFKYDDLSQFGLDKLMLSGSYSKNDIRQMCELEKLTGQT